MQFLVECFDVHPVPTTTFGYYTYMLNQTALKIDFDEFTYDSEQTCDDLSYSYSIIVSKSSDPFDIEDAFPLELDSEAQFMKF